jgi:glycogen debranching enzyme
MGDTLAWGRQICGDLAAGESREWLCANGIGGYASGTVAGTPTRRYHGLLVAALEPPLGRTLLAAQVHETVTYDGQSLPLATSRWASGAVAPDGYRHIESFRLDGTTPVWTYACGDALVEKRVWMEPGANTTVVRYAVLRAREPVALALRVLANYRDYHATTRAGDWRMEVAAVPHGVRVRAFDGARPFVLLAAGAEARLAHTWFRDFSLAREAARGLDHLDDALHVVTFEAALQPGASLTLVASAEAAPTPDGEAAWQRRVRHEAGVRRRWIDARPESTEEIFAVSLPESPLSSTRQRAVVDAVASRLLTSYGLRSLAPEHPDYRGRYGGDQWARDGAYHQGTVWAWLLGPFALAHHRVYRDAEAARSFLLPLADHLGEYGVGSIAEIFDGEAPFRPGGCVAQAWSVAETLRAWHELTRHHDPG